MARPERGLLNRPDETSENISRHLVVFALPFILTRPATGFRPIQLLWNQVKKTKTILSFLLSCKLGTASQNIKCLRKRQLFYEGFAQTPQSLFHNSHTRCATGYGNLQLSQLMLTFYGSQHQLQRCANVAQPIQDWAVKLRVLMCFHNKQ